ncbi:hypothetical protein ABKN59_001276 [Abortiporus biennis]
MDITEDKEQFMLSYYGRPLTWLPTVVHSTKEHLEHLGFDERAVEARLPCELDSCDNINPNDDTHSIIEISSDSEEDEEKDDTSGAQCVRRSARLRHPRPTRIHKNAQLEKYSVSRNNRRKPRKRNTRRKRSAGVAEPMGSTSRTSNSTPSMSVNICLNTNPASSSSTLPLPNTALENDPMTVAGFLISLKLGHLTTLFARRGFSSADDLKLLISYPDRTKEIVLKSMLDDNGVGGCSAMSLKDFGTLHAALLTSTSWK